MSFSWIYPRCTRFDAEDVQQIVGAATRLAAQIPWTVDASDEFYDSVASFGFRVNDTKVQATQAVIDRTMQAIESRRKALQSEPKLDSPSTELSFSVSGQGIWCCDPETDRVRAATKADLADFSRAVSAFPDLGRTHPTFLPQNVPFPTQDLHTLITVLLNSDKPCRVDVYSPGLIDYFLSAYSIYYGSEEKGREAMGSGDLWPATIYVNTPFMISREAIEAGLALRRVTGQPLKWGHMPVMGAATPVTPAGALALSTAETVGINALALALDGELYGWVSPGMCSVDMKTLLATQWGSEVMVTQAASVHVAEALFGERVQPRYSNCTAAKRPGAQSMMERSMGFGMSFLAGARSFGSLATLAFADIGSLVQALLDLELGSMMQKMAEGFSVTSETLAEEVIREVAPTGARFLETEHTARHFREVLWMPQFMDRQVATSALDGVPSMVDNARSRALELVRTAPNRCPLDQGQTRALENLLAEADRALAR